MSTTIRSLAFPVIALALLAAPAAAQQASWPESVRDWLENCRDNADQWDRRGHACEVRHLAIARGTRAITIDGRTNGGVRVHGWDRDSIAVFALIQANGEDDGDAREIAGDVSVSTSGGRVSAEGPRVTRRRSGWSVSYHVFAPRRIDLDARTHNGGIGVDGITGRIDVEAVNGGIAMRNVGGDVRGHTTNGGVKLALSGDRWEGRGVDLSTTNGGISLDIPERYNARLETSTVNGGFNIDFPITLQGRIGRELNTTLGQGGALIRVRTTNGGVKLARSR